MNQKEFLLELEQVCGIKKPLFLDTRDTWEYPEHKLKRAKDLTNLPVIGRYRLTLENSEVSELWFDLEIPEDKEFKELAKLALETLKLIKSFGIKQEYIYIKLSGHGIHIQVFISGLRGWSQLKTLAKVIHQKLPMSKTHSLGSDPRCLVKHQKIREFGGKNGEHYTTAIKLKDLQSAKRKKKYPINKKADAVVYPKVKVFKCTKQMINRIHELESEFELTKEAETYGSETDYDKDGDIQNLYKCPVIARLAKKAKTEHHLTHAERLTVCQTFICFGQDGQDEIHKILSHCADYDKEYTQWVIEDNKKRGYRPFTCQWINDHVGCPKNCKGSGGKSPFKFAWTPLPLKDVLKAYREILILHPDDDEVIETCMCSILDPHVAGQPTWLFLIAPSSSGKTVIITSLHNPKWSITKDLITSKTLVTGKTYRDPKTKEERLIEGLLPKLYMKTLLIKEFTTQLMHGEESRNAIFSQLRAIYDGRYDVSFGSIDSSKIPEKWKITRMGFLAGCTAYIDRYATLNALLGERYLKIRIKKPNVDQAIEKSVLLSFDIDKKVKNLNKKVTRFLANIKIPKFELAPKKYRTKIRHLAVALVMMRKPVTIKERLSGIREYGVIDDTEYPMRLAMQLHRLGFMLGVIRGTGWNDGIIKTLVRIAFDTISPSRAAIIRFLLTKQNPVSQHEIRTALGWSHQRITNHLTQLCMAGAVIGDQTTNFKIHPELRKRLNKVGYLNTGHTSMMRTTSNNKIYSVPIVKAPNLVDYHAFATLEHDDTALRREVTRIILLLELLSHAVKC